MHVLHLLTSSIRDLVIRWLPITNDLDPPGFAFIVHPRNYEDVSRKYPFFSHIPRRVGEFFLRHYWPVVLSEVTGVKTVHNKKPVRGWIISIPLTAKQMMEDRERTILHIKKSLVLARKLGARTVGLGALTASFTGRGTALAHIADRLGIGITTGAAYTSYIVTKTAEQLAMDVGLDKKNTVIAIVGAGGSIGSTSLHYFVDAGFTQFILIDTEKRKQLLYDLAKEARDRHPHVTCVLDHKIERIKEARIIITATNAPEALITENDPSPGSIIVDDAQPSDIHPDVIRNRSDIIVTGGGNVYAPHIHAQFNFGLKKPHDIFSCLAEVIILASSGDYHTRALGKVDFSYAKTIIAKGNRLGFSVARYQNPYKIITKRDINNVRKHNLS